uniref:Disease resistance R13L4/SHOC-2-like LRR domain-containing protein n=1 Tax=Arundo donax TaxID=35708 RepID=A0A0A9FZB9_ARUDO
MGNMKNLQELEWINVFQYSLNFLQELGELTDLRKLSIIWRTADIEGDKASYKEKLVTSLCKLDTYNLRTLRIHFYLREDEGLAGDPFCPALDCIRQIFLHSSFSCRISAWLVSLVNLEYLDITVKEIERRDLELIGNIPTLLDFRMLLTGTGQQWPVIITGGFQQLQKFRLHSVPLGTGLIVEAGAMPLLNNLELGIQLDPFKSSVSFEQTFKSTVADFDFGIQHLSCLSRFSLEINCGGIWPAYVEAAVGAFKSMVEMHPNRPTLEITSMFHDQDDENATNNRSYKMIIQVKGQNVQSAFQDIHK